MTLKRYAEQRILKFLVSEIETKTTKEVQIRFSVQLSPLKENWFDSLLPFFPYIYLRFSFPSSREIAAFEFWTREKSHSPREAKNSMAITRQVGKFITRFFPLTRATVQHPSEYFSFPSVKYKAVSRNVCNLLGEVDF